MLSPVGCSYTNTCALDDRYGLLVLFVASKIGLGCLAAELQASGNVGDGDFIVADAAIEIGEQGGGFGSDDSGLAVLAGESVDGFKGLPERCYENLGAGGHRAG